MAENVVAPERIRSRVNWSSVVLLAGFCGGAIDFAHASISARLAGHSMLKPWQGIAAFLLRRMPDESDWPAACLGAAAHFAIAAVMAAVLALAMNRIPVLRRRPILGGLVYGVGLYLVMLGVVLPLLVPGRFFLWHGVASIQGILVHMAVGLTMALVIAHGLKRAEPSPKR